MIAVVTNSRELRGPLDLVTNPGKVEAASIAVEQRRVSREIECSGGKSL